MFDQESSESTVIYVTASSDAFVARQIRVRLRQKRNCAFFSSLSKCRGAAQ